MHAPACISSPSGSGETPTQANKYEIRTITYNIDNIDTDDNIIYNMYYYDDIDTYDSY